jgi:CheY-like chemotaxis protein
MDIMMPQISGGDAVRILRADERTKHIPVIFLTAIAANMPQGDEDKGVNVDGQFYKLIAKPIETGKLLFEIKSLIGDK